MMRMASAIAIAWAGGALAQPAWVARQAQDQISQSQMRMAIGRAAAAGRGGGEAAFDIAYLAVYAKGKTYHGLGEFRYKQGNPRLQIPDAFYIRLGNLTFFPDQTDSIAYLDRVGIADGDAWLFQRESGKIAAYSASPLGDIVRVAYEGGPIRDLDGLELSNALASVPIAYAFKDIDRAYAIRMYNEYRGMDSFDPKYGVTLQILKDALFAKTLHSWTLANFKRANPRGVIERLVKARYACQDKASAEADSVLRVLKAELPDFYAVHAAEGACREAHGDAAGALESYRAARMFSPDDDDIRERLAEAIARAGKPPARGR